MSFFKGVKKAKGITKPTADTVGGYTPIPSDVHRVKVTAAYGVLSSKSDAQAVRVELEFADLNKRKSTQSIWITNAEGEVFSEYEGKKRYKAGYLQMDALALLATEGEVGILDLETEPKIIKVKRDGVEVNEEVESFPDLVGFEFQIGIVDTIKWKQNNVDGTYVDTDETQHEAAWHTLFDIDGFTLIELENEADEPEFIHEWSKAWKGKTRPAPEKKENKAKGARRNTSDSGTKPASRSTNRRSMIRGQ